MASPRGKNETDRAKALGSLVRELRRDRDKPWTLKELADRIPMSASNLSRLELGNQGPPSDEVISQIAKALGVEPDRLLKAAGRTSPGSFEEQVMKKLEALQEEMRNISRAVKSGRQAP